MSRHRLVALSFILFAAQSGAAFAQPAKTDAWEAGARAADTAYWTAYNRADPVAMNAWLAPDVEFYHDRGGKLIGKKALSAANAVMKTSANRLRREAIAGSVHFFPMREGEKVYGAVVTGRHRFYVKESGKPEFVAGDADFSHLMLLQGKEWRIARIFSYEHVDAPAAGK